MEIEYIKSESTLKAFNPLQPGVAFIYPLKTPEYL